jgi:hypothetical protein
LLRREFSFERVEKMDVMGWRCGLSVEEYINPGRMNIERRPSICEIADSASLTS